VGHVDPRNGRDVATLGKLPDDGLSTPLRITVTRTARAVSEHVVLREIRARRHAIQGCVDIQPWTIRAHPYILSFHVGTDGVASIPTYDSKTLYGVEGPPSSSLDLARSELAMRCVVGALDGLRFTSSEKSGSTFEITVAAKAMPAPSSRP